MISSISRGRAADAITRDGWSDGSIHEVTELYRGGPLCIADDVTECECRRCSDKQDRWERDQGWPGDDGRGDDNSDNDEDWCTCSRSAQDHRDHVGPCDWCGKELGP